MWIFIKLGNFRGPRSSYNFFSKTKFQTSSIKSLLTATQSLWKNYKETSLHWKKCDIFDNYLLSELILCVCAPCTEGYIFSFSFPKSWRHTLGIYVFNNFFCRSEYHVFLEGGTKSRFATFPKILVKRDLLLSTYFGTRVLTKYCGNAFPPIFSGTFR